MTLLAVVGILALLVGAFSLGGPMINTSTTPTTTPAASVEEQPLEYYTLVIPLKRGIEYHFIGYQCWVEREGFDHMGRPIPLRILAEEEKYILFKVDTHDDVPAEAYWVDVQCVEPHYSDPLHRGFEETISQYGPLTWSQWNYVENGSIQFSMWWIQP
jgi:hypothetical protein